MNCCRLNKLTVATFDNPSGMRIHEALQVSYN